jgi:hypothetical protein
LFLDIRLGQLIVRKGEGGVHLNRFAASLYQFIRKGSDKKKLCKIGIYHWGNRIEIYSLFYFRGGLCISSNQAQVPGKPMVSSCIARIEFYCSPELPIGDCEILFGRPTERPVGMDWDSRSWKEVPRVCRSSQISMDVMPLTKFRTSSGPWLVRITCRLPFAACSVCFLGKLLNYLEELL